MAWTAATRGDYVRPSGSYASDVTDREWALIAPLLPAARPGGRPRTTCLRRVVNAIFYLLQAGCQWRMLPRDFPPRSTVYGYFRAWIAAGVWAHVHDVLYRRTRELEGRDESVPHPPLEAFGEGVLGRLARPDVAPVERNSFDQL